MTAARQRDDLQLTDELRAALRALLTNSANPEVSQEQVQELVRRRLAAYWGTRIAITLAGRLAAHPPDEDLKR